MSFQVIDSLLLTESVRDAVSGLRRVSSSLEKPSADCISLLMEYKALLQSACSSLDVEKYPGLLDLVIILEEGLDLLIARDYSPDAFETQFLAEFADLFLDYLSMPKSKIAAGILVKHFKKTKWVRPINLEEHRFLMDYIVQGKQAGTSNDNEKVIDLNRIDADLEVVSLSDYAGSDESSADVLSIDEFVNGSEEIELTSSDGTVANGESVTAESESIDLNDFIGGVESSEVVEEIDLSSFLVNDKLSTGDSAEPLRDSSDKVEQSSLAIDSIGEPGSLGPSDEINDQHKELLDLVTSELEGVEQQIKEMHGQVEADLIHSGLQNLAEEAENIGNAFNLIGLEGLSRASQHISENILEISKDRSIPSQSILEEVYRWPAMLAQCLQNLYDSKKRSQLTEYLQAQIWPDSLSADSLDELSALLENPSFIEEEVETRQVEATEDDVSLALPEDVNQELLDGLLQDLPSQTSEFSSSIQKLTEHGDLENLDVAQRIAHTLKGAANVVGVKGIANLTHHLEDILEIQAKARKMPGQELAVILLEASDCLETMSDTLLGVDAPPDNARQILQAVLDWANRLDQQGADEVGDNSGDELQSVDQAVTALPSTEKSPVSNNEIRETKDQHIPENVLRVPVVLADELLRLAGENLISTGQIQEHIKYIFRSQEAIRLHNQALQQLSFDLEHLVDIQGVAAQLNNNEDYGDFDPLEMDQYNEMHSISRRLVEIAADATAFSSGLETQLTELGDLVVEQNQIQKENQELVLRTRMVAASTIAPRLKRGVRQACRLTGKQADLVIEDNDTMMDSEVLNNLIEPLMHLLRNSVDHGIEEPRERMILGKPEMGAILLTFSQSGDQIVIHIKDDGRGLNLSSILDRAVEKGLVQPDAEISEDALSRLILESGFSTRNEVTHVSGRGIGLDVVSVKVRELKGAISIKSQAGDGCDFELRLPVSSFSAHSLLVQVREHIYAISNRGVEEILYPGLGDISDIGDETIFQMDDQVYSAVVIDDLLNMPEDRREIDRSTRPVLLVKDDMGTRTAILVQDVVDSRDVVVKPLGPYMPKIDGVIGATVLGDGSIASVIDLPEMLLHRAGKSIRQESSKDHYIEPEAKRLPYVLVVDDSLSARRSLAQFVQDLGLDVRTARDGMEAVSLIEARRPDLMLIDMEMPRMNGLELTSHIRASSQTNRLPVIMITSRSTDKHRAAALEKGVNHFMVKPFAEDELAHHITEALEEAS